MPAGESQHLGLRSSQTLFNRGDLTSDFLSPFLHWRTAGRGLRDVLKKGFDLAELSSQCLELRLVGVCLVAIIGIHADLPIRALLCGLELLLKSLDRLLVLRTQLVHRTLLLPLRIMLLRELALRDAADVPVRETAPAVLPSALPAVLRLQRPTLR